jgi:hypothetical protein
LVTESRGWARDSVTKALETDNGLVRRPRQPAESEDPSPFLELAREIQAEVARIAADPSAHSELLFEFIEGIPQEERMKLARRIFGALPAERQWAVIAEVYGDEAITSYLEAERSAHLADARAAEDRRQWAATARAEQRLDTRSIPAGALLTLGLFCERDVRAALTRGHTSSTCARRVVLRAMGAGEFQVLEDVFNPNGGYFVTAEYSEETWRTSDRLPAHAIVRAGSITEGAAVAGASFEPIVYPGGRVDFELGGQPTAGRLHLGFAMLGDVGIFAS